MTAFTRITLFAAALALVAGTEIVTVKEAFAAPGRRPAWERRHSPNLRKVGDCETTKITGIGTRFGLAAPPAEDAGTSVIYANGVQGISYGLEPAVAASKVGDVIWLCLATLPKNCPKGDTRGRGYLALNKSALRRAAESAGVTWYLSDNQHGCGGA